MKRILAAFVSALLLCSTAISADYPEGRFQLKNVMIEEMLPIYMEMTGFELVVDSRVKAVRHLISSVSPELASKADAQKYLETLLLEGAGVVVTRLDDKRVSVTYNDALPVKAMWPPAPKTRPSTPSSSSTGSSQTNLESKVSGLTFQLSSADFETRFKAGQALFTLGSNAAPAVATIGRLLQNEPDKIHDIMLLVLENCPDEAKPIKPTLEKYLTNSNPVLRIQCTRTLWVLDHSYSNQARLVAQKSLGESDAGVRVDGASLLWRLDHDAKAVVPTLIALLSDKDKAFDYRTIRFLGNIGPQAKEAIPAIQSWLKSGRMHEAFATNAAVAALQNIEGNP